MNQSGDPMWESSTVVIHRSASRTVLEAAQMTLAEEEIPSLVELVHGGTEGGWCLKVSAAAQDEAERLLENRKALGSLVDWDNLDVGEPSEEVQAVLKGRERLRRFTSVLWVLGLTVGIITLGLAGLGIILAVLR
jgi:hypothetical protein